MAGTGTAMAQAVTTADYARAASMLGDRTGPLVDHAVSGAQWLDDGSLIYREQTDGKTRYLRFDPATGKTAAAAMTNTITAHTAAAHTARRGF